MKTSFSSHSHPKQVVIPKPSKEFAEFLGAYFGDGSTTENPPAVVISLSYSDENEYALFLSGLASKLFQTTVGMVEHKIVDNVRVRIYRISLVRHLKMNVHREEGIPDWVKRKKEYLVAFIRGLIDCEGSVYRVEKGKRRIRIEVKMRNKKLLEDLKSGLEFLHYSPHLYPKRNRVVLARQEEVDTYLKKIGFHNPKHIKRYLSLRENHVAKLR